MIDYAIHLDAYTELNADNTKVAVLVHIGGGRTTLKKINRPIKNLNYIKGISNTNAIGLIPYSDISCIEIKNQ